MSFLAVVVFFSLQFTAQDRSQCIIFFGFPATLPMKGALSRGKLNNLPSLSCRLCATGVDMLLLLANDNFGAEFIPVLYFRSTVLGPSVPRLHHFGEDYEVGRFCLLSLFEILVFLVGLDQFKRFVYRVGKILWNIIAAIPVC